MYKRLATMVLFAAAVLPAAPAVAEGDNPGGSAAALSGRDEFNRAIAAEKEAKLTEALAILKALGKSKGDFADDGYLEAGRVCEEELLDGMQAMEMYAALLRDYPNSRLQRRAAARLEALRGTDPRFLRPALEFRRAILDFPKDNKAAMERVLGLIEKTPDYPGADHAYFWLGEVSRGKGDIIHAAGFYHTVIQRFPQSAWAWKARRSLGDIEYERKSYGEAADLYREAAGAPDQYLHAAAVADAERAETHQFRERIANLSFLALLLGWAGLIASLLRLPTGIRIALHPVRETWVLIVLSAGVLCAAGFFQPRHLTGIALVLAAFLVSTQLSGALLRYRSLKPAGKIAYLVASAAIGSGVIYGAVVKMGLMGSVIHTLKFGTG